MLRNPPCSATQRTAAGTIYALRLSAMENKKTPLTTPATSTAHDAHALVATAVTAAQIKPDQVVVCSQNGQLGIVEHMQGATSIMLKKDAKGVAHYIPLSWVKSVDAKVHLDRPGAQAMKEWTDKAPMADKSAGATTRQTDKTVPTAKA